MLLRQSIRLKRSIDQTSQLETLSNQPKRGCHSTRLSFAHQAPISLESSTIQPATPSSSSPSDPETPPFVLSLQAIYAQHRNASRALSMKRYLRDQFDFIGLSKPQRDAVQSGLVKQWRGDFPSLHSTVSHLWQLPEREYQYAALDLMAGRHAAQLLLQNPVASLRLLERCIREKSWWDTVDCLASKMVGNLVKMHREELGGEMDKWNRDEDMWIRRASLLYQLHYKPPELDLDRQFRSIVNLMEEEDFFIRKAIGWVLRQHSKVRGDECKPQIIAFLNAHRSKLSTLSIREASKYL